MGKTNGKQPKKRARTGRASGTPAGKPGRGGKRQGAGRPPGPEATTVSLRIPTTLLAEIDDQVARENKTRTAVMLARLRG